MYSSFARRKVKKTIPSLEELFLLTKDGSIQLSTTNLVHINSLADTVFKATLNTPLNSLSDSSADIIALLGSKVNVAIETKTLKFLEKNRIQVPKVIGFNERGDVFAMQYIRGITLLDKLIFGNLNENDVSSAADMLSRMHKIINSRTNKKWVENHSKSYPLHFPNRIEGFLNKYEALSKVENSVLRNTFIEAKAVLDAHPEYMVWHDATYGDYKPENIIQRPNEELVLFDPGLRFGRVSFDAGKFASRLLLHKAPKEMVRKFVDTYLAHSSITTTELEIKHMAALDMITILAVYDSIPKNQSAMIFPDRIYDLIKHIDIISKSHILPLLEGNY